MKDKKVFTDHHANTRADGMVDVFLQNEKITVTVDEYLRYICSDIDWEHYDEYTKTYLSNLVLNRKIENLLK